MLFKAILIAAWAGLCALDQFGPHLGFRKPLLAGVVVGIILGDFTQGLIIAGTLELVWLGTNNVGAYQPPDVISGAVTGVAIGILSGGGEAAGVAVAIPVARLGQQLSMAVMTLNIGLVHRADHVISDGEFGKIDKLQYLGALSFFLSRAIPVFIAVYFGAPAVQAVLDAIPAQVLTGLQVASKIIPAVGLALLLSMMMKKDMWIFLIIGFTLATYLNIPIIGLALLAIAFAGIYDKITSQETSVASATPSATSQDIEEGDYDL